MDLMKTINNARNIESWSSKEKMLVAHSFLRQFMNENGQKISEGVKTLDGDRISLAYPNGESERIDFFYEGNKIDSMSLKTFKTFQSFQQLEKYFTSDLNFNPEWISVFFRYGGVQTEHSLKSLWEFLND